MKTKSSPINIIWFSMIAVSLIVASFTGKMEEVNSALFGSAKGAVTLAIGLIGPMALWLGIMKVAEAGGAMKAIARLLRPVMIRLFPDVPTDHPAMSAIIMNMAANMLGLGNAATPMGIKAMQELKKLSPSKDTATDSMALFLAINTSSVTLLPLGVITVRASAGSNNPASILIPSLIATIVSTTVAIVSAKFLARSNPLSPLIPTQTIEAKENNESDEVENTNSKLNPPAGVKKWFGIFLIFAFVTGILYQIFNSEVVAGLAPLFSRTTVTGLTNWLIPIILLTILGYGFFKGVELYETVTEGAKEGFSTAIRIIPFMVAIFVAIGLIRASGTLEILNTFLGSTLSLIGMPTEALPMALIRPLSGSGAFGVMSEIVNNNPNSFVADVVSVMQGSTETTFYVLAVYFGAVGISKTRHALPAALMADVAGIIAAVFTTHLFLG